jgi:hypothetical protein
LTVEWSKTTMATHVKHEEYDVENLMMISSSFQQQLLNISTNSVPSENELKETLEICFIGSHDSMKSAVLRSHSTKKQLPTDVHDNPINWSKPITIRNNADHTIEFNRRDLRPEDDQEYVRLRKGTFLNECMCHTYTI